jgi:hypothetical protein
MAGSSDPIGGARRHHLAALAYEAGARGLACRLVGPGEGVLSVVEPRRGRSTMVVVIPSSPNVWSYLWGDGGVADTSDPAAAADLIAAFLT